MTRWIQVNLHPAGRINNMTFGLCNIADGFVRVISLGFLHSTFALTHTRNTARRRIKQLKAGE